MFKFNHINNNLCWNQPYWVVPGSVRPIRSSRNLWWRSSFATWPIIYDIAGSCWLPIGWIFKKSNELRHNFNKIGLGFVFLYWVVWSRVFGPPWWSIEWFSLSDLQEEDLDSDSIITAGSETGQCPMYQKKCIFIKDMYNFTQ